MTNWGTYTAVRLRDTGHIDPLTTFSQRSLCRNFVTKVQSQLLKEDKCKYCMRTEPHECRNEALTHGTCTG